MHIEVTTSPAPEDLRFLSEGIQDYNRRTVPGIAEVSDDLRFAAFARDTDGNLLGGIRAGAFWGYLCIELLWLSEAARGGGIGSQLVASAEAFARKHGFTRARVETTSFQARPFYERLGYAVFGVLEDCPPGHCSYYLKKDLGEVTNGATAD
ncbi:MAG TPA: GNAT family N-acetyltransferase [Rhodanobacter sp.]|nr:GNAT family N-acetyltransferase [Rhodanobacter sp.]